MKRALVLLVLIAACGGEGDKNVSTSPNVPEKTYTLKVFLSDGVSGNLGAGEHGYKAGEIVTYSFSTKSGFRRVMVESQNNILATSGNIVMNSDQELSATAEAAPPTLSADAEKARVGVLQILAAQDSASIVNAFANHLQSLTNYNLADEEAAYRAVADIARSEDLDRANLALSGSIWDLSQAPATGSVSPNLVEASSSQVTLVVVNGAYNSRDAAALMWKELEKLVNGGGLGGIVNVVGFYNASSFYDTDTQKKCLRIALEYESYSKLRACGWLLTGDLIEAKKQIAEIINNVPSQSKEVAALTKLIKSLRAKGQKVLLLAHSQGALVANQALKSIGRFDSCVGSISLADPLSQASWAPQAGYNLRGFVVSGERVEDIILYLGRNDFPKLGTNLTKAADERVKALDNPNLALAYAGAGKIFEDLRLHFFLESYMAGTESRAEILSALLDRSTILLFTICTPVFGEASRIPS